MDSPDDRQADTAAEALAAALEAASEDDLDRLLVDTDEIAVNPGARVWLERVDRLWHLPPHGNANASEPAESGNAPAGNAVLVA